MSDQGMSDEQQRDIDAAYDAIPQHDEPIDQRTAAALGHS